jgi:hypothetical protein
MTGTRKGVGIHVFLPAIQEKGWNEEISDREFPQIWRRVNQRCYSGPWKGGRGSPPPADRLPIDDEIDQLLKRRRSPSIDVDLADKLCRRIGPYRYARVRFYRSRRLNSEPEIDQRVAAVASDAARRIAKVDAALKQLRSLPLDQIEREYTRYRDNETDDEEWESRHYLSRRLTSFCDNVEESLASLAEDIEWHRDHSLLRLWSPLRASRKAGHPASMWKPIFVDIVAGVFLDLTGCVPTANPDSIFGRFLDAAWASLPGDLPLVSFERAQREVARRWRKSRVVALSRERLTR